MSAINQCQTEITSEASQEVLVTATKVADDDRLDVLPRHFPKSFLKFENLVYNMTEHVCSDYQGGFWEFYELSNGGLFMAPQSDNEWQVSVPGNYFEGSVSSQVLGIISSLFALNALAHTDELAADKYYQLLDHVRSHPDQGVIYRAID